MSHTTAEAHAPHAQRPTDGPSRQTPSGDGPQLPTAPAATTEPDLCGQEHKYHTKDGKEIAKPCLKARGHSGPHSSRKQGTKIEIPSLADMQLEVETVPTGELLEQVTERVRDERQLAADKHVIESYERWLAAGKPAGFNDAIKAGAANRYRCNPDHAAAVRKILKNTDNVNGKAGVGGSKNGIHCRIAAPKKSADGTVMIYFLGVDKSEARATAGASQSQPQAQQRPVPTPQPPHSKK